MSKTLKKEKTKDIEGKQELLLVSLNDFYDNEYNKLALMDILNGKNKISLRIIDWFVTNYSKKNNIEYPLKKKMTSPKRTTLKRIHGKSSKKDDSRNSSNVQHINVFLSYKNQLDGYSKKHFDPFCRRNRIEFTFNDNNKIVTTVGQLNFFRWAIQSNVLNYIIENYKNIEEDMNINTKKKKDGEQKKSGKGSSSKKQRKKRAPLSVAATKNMNVNKNPITIDFE
jgi:hypothetical protein